MFLRVSSLIYYNATVLTLCLQPKKIRRGLPDWSDFPSLFQALVSHFTDCDPGNPLGTLLEFRRTFQRRNTLEDKTTFTFCSTTPAHLCGLENVCRASVCSGSSRQCPPFPSGNKSVIPDTNQSTSEELRFLSLTSPIVQFASKSPGRPLPSATAASLPGAVFMRQVAVACCLSCHTPQSRDECGSCLGGQSGYFGLPSIHPSSAGAYSAIRAAGWPQPNKT